MEFVTQKISVTMDPESAVQKSMMMHKVRKHERAMIDKPEFAKIIKQKEASKSIKEEKTRKVVQMRRKEDLVNRTFSGFNGKITLGKFAILDESEVEEEVQSTRTPSPAPKPVAVTVSVKPAKKQHQPKLHKASYAPYLASCVVIVLAIFLNF